MLLHEFPKLSETFVLADLLALEERGVRLHVFSLRQPQADLSQGGVAALRAPVEYLPEISGRQRSLVTRAVNMAMFVRDPRRYAAGLVEVYASPDFSRVRHHQAVLLARALMRLGAPPLYVHFAHRPATVGRFASLLLGTPFAVSAHAVDVWTSPASELKVKLGDASVVLCCYEEARDYLARLTAGRTPVKLARHGVDIPANPVRAEVSPPVVLAVGRLIEKKGFDTLLRAAALLRERGAEFRLHIAGDGPLWPNLARLVGELGLVDYTRFLGPLTHEELEPHFAGATVFALPSQVAADGNRDGLPNTILEAMARRLPVVSTTLPSVIEAIEDGREGLLVPPRDAGALADALARLLEDANVRARLGEAGRERVKREHDRAVLAGRPYEVLVEAGLIADRGT